MDSITDEQWFLETSGMLGNDNLGPQSQVLPGKRRPGKKKYPTHMYSDRNNTDTMFSDFKALISPELESFDFPPSFNGDTIADNNEDVDIDWSQLNLDLSVEQRRANAQQRRVSSGTAIFGFSNHDKNLMFSNTNLNPTEYPNPSEELIKQEVDLQLALAKQRETNRKLEEELYKNMLKQENLNKQISKQKISSSKILQDSKFPEVSLDLETEDLFDLESSDVINGSPSKKPNRGKLSIIHNYNDKIPVPQNKRKSSNIVREMERFFQETNTQNKENISYGKISVPHKFDQNIVTYGKQLISPALSSKFSPALSNLDGISESIMGDNQYDLDDDSNGSSNMPLGLGLHSDRRSSVNILPTIPSSIPGSPIQRIQSNPNDVRSGSNNKSTVNGGSFTKFQTTPSLKPPSSRTTSHGYLDVNNEDGNCTPYNTSPSSSPVMRNQGQFELNLINSNTFGEASPIKITRKPTTLPRGSIDIYVKEMPDKKFQCLYPKCDKTFKRRYNIRSHIQTHLEDRPYKCDFEGCDKAFVRNHDLIRHKKSHAEKSYACPCGKKFNREDALIVHRSRMICSGGKKYENVVIKRSPRKRGRPRKDGSDSVNCSPVKESVKNDSNGYVMKKIEEQISSSLDINTMAGAPQPPFKFSNKSLLLSPASQGDFSDFDPSLNTNQEFEFSIY
ncbi:hypothetical protein Kpol_1036p70 [Vanderwaltozyma polyspora DSM 70294]|uniref:C2H2-type domain-containing protein n=1 Tax=Vanderwaltozyma polyspora (strain ATCC 22028 / DSM 70294 / BCRC 21397 / CBS 2163 / NBRC 10782 / NRRL Y-8283 / UCD 57-17) TaxID=436907 RepID=A7TEL7_VANPO|nr:uncharacterized protein Kpol_1036p70 [Vanderwaltozyma polyspora DSM 70294]EDO19324.1 hypothetical protein Kpol_1036p70 [Vanderwaltozyma polyspora DSM 70294]